MKKQVISAICILFIALFALTVQPAAVWAAPDQGTSELAFDVVFVIDASGSMLNSDPEKLAIEASMLFTDMCEYSTSRIGYVLYTHELVKTMDLSAISDETFRASLRNDLNQIAYAPHGDTDIALGLTAAMNMLVNGNSFNGERNPLIILLSDGNTDLPKGPRTVEESEAELNATTLQLQQLGAPVYTIGLNADGSLDVAAMQQIAATTQAKFYETSRAADLPGILSEIFADHIRVKEMELVSFVCDGSSRRVTIPIPNDNIYEANIIILSSREVKDLHLYAPGGLEVSMPSNSIYLNQSRSYNLIKIVAPMKGDWALELTGTEGDTITINLLRSYDFQLGLALPAERVLRNQPTAIAVGFQDENGFIEDSNVFIGAKGTLMIKNVATGKTETVALVQDGSRMAASVVFADVGNYEISARVVGADDSFVKEADAAALAVVPVALSLAREKIDAVLFTGLFNTRSYPFAELAAGEADGILTVEPVFGQEGALLELAVDQAGQNVRITAQKPGTAEFNLIIKDAFGQAVTLPVKIKVLAVWPFILAILAILLVAALLLLKSWRDHLPPLRGKLAVSIDGTRNSPPSISVTLDSLKHSKGDVPLTRIVGMDMTYGAQCSQALAEIGPFALGITVRALDKDGQQIMVRIPADKAAGVKLNYAEITGSKTATMDKKSELPIQYDKDGAIYEIHLAFGRDPLDDLMGQANPFGGRDAGPFAAADPFAGDENPFAKGP